MKKHLLTLALLCACSATTLLPAQAKREHKEPETELGQSMEKFGGTWRKLRKQAADPALNASSAELVATLSEGMTKALAFKPARAEDVPAGERERFIAAYQAGLKEFIAQLTKLEAAFRANDNTGAQALLQKLGAMQKEAHKEFKRPDK